MRPISRRNKIIGDIGAITRHHGDHDPRLDELRQELRELTAAERIRALIAKAPPLTAAQRDRLAGLLRSNPDTAA